MTKEYKDADTLRRLYWDEGKSLPQLGDHFGISATAVGYWMDKFGIPRRTSTREKPPHFSTDSSGYERIVSKVQGEDKQIYIHRLVAVAECGFEQVVGKEIHHKNGIKWDNRPSNLEVLSSEDHQEKHSQSEYGNEPYRDRSVLEKLYVEQKLSTHKIGDRLGCDHTTVLRWLKRYDIPLRSKGGKPRDANCPHQSTETHR